jgi:hypothetical protein
MVPCCGHFADNIVGEGSQEIISLTMSTGIITTAIGSLRRERKRKKRSLAPPAYDINVAAAYVRHTVVWTQLFAASEKAPEYTLNAGLLYLNT